MFSNHIMNKGIKSLETDLPVENSSISKIKLITEELLYLKLLKNHKLFMTFCLMFHVSLISLLILKSYLKTEVIENNFFCKYASLITNITYLFLNISLLIVALGCLRKGKAILSNINYYDKLGNVFILNIVMSFFLIFYHFLPDYFCKNLSIGLKVSVIMNSHIVFENLLFLFYIKWFNGQLRNFGALIN